MDLGNILGSVGNAARLYRQIQDDLDPPQPSTRIWDALVGEDTPVQNVPVSQRVSMKGKGCRRRRRRLLTKSDLGDIAALKGIVGTGKNFENILAAAMYRSR